MDNIIMNQQDLINFRDVEYNKIKYTVIKSNTKTNKNLFVIDIENKDKVQSRNWHKNMATGYIGSTVYENNIKKELYLHNFIQNNLILGIKGQVQTIDHINRIPTDNRKENLRLLSQSAQNMNQSKRTRHIDLPKDCNIIVENIPKNVYFHKEDLRFGSYFEIDIKNMPDGSRFRKKSSKSKNISLKCKLEEIKKYLNELGKKYPTLIDERNINTEYGDKAIELIKSYNEIIKLSGFKFWEENIVPIPEQKKYTENDTKILSKKEKLIIKNVSIDNTNNKKKIISTLPINCQIKKEMIPKYCYYKSSDQKRGDCFIIDNHPLLKKVENKGIWSTTTLRNISTDEKFFYLIQKLNQLYDSDL
jgi:hypothetical protein